MAFCAPVLLAGSRGRPPGRARAQSARCSAESLVVVGAGALGGRVARLWRSLHVDARVVCVTATRERHAALAAAGLTPALVRDLREPADFVVFCVPPGRFADDEYAGMVAGAAKLAHRRLVYTSSTGVFASADVVVRERSPTKDTRRARTLLAAERAALASPIGTVLRLGGLYCAAVGAHRLWLQRGEAPTSPDCLLNMLQHDDAASAVVRALAAEHDRVVGQRLIVTDDQPITMRDMLEAARAHPLYAAFDSPTYGEGGPSKRIDGAWSRERLGWQPQHSGFAEFMRKDREMMLANAK